METLKYESKNICAKAALDMALWSLKAQLEKKTIGELLGIESVNFPLGAYTIGVCSFEEMRLKLEDANRFGFELFKLKMNGEKDEEMVGNFRKLSDKQFAVDVNQGWKTVQEATDKIAWLREQGCLFVEQPLKKDELDEMKLLKEKSALPLYADESCQHLEDLERMVDCFDGVNVKLMKCGGVTEAHKMILKARELGLKILIGCMSESSVGCTAASHLTPLADYADLDGPYLIANDPFGGMEVRDGRIFISDIFRVDKLSIQ
jgi:L-alanine-DL-glutamate epimerase-like enolase superfamily enzyme